MLNAASKTKKFFSRAYDTPNPLWCLKPQEEMMAEYNIKSKEARKYIFNCLDDMARVNMPKYESSELQVEKVFDSSISKFDKSAKTHLFLRKNEISLRAKK